MEDKDIAVNISQLKKSPSRVLADASGSPVAIFDHGRVFAYLLPAELYKQMLERLDDFELVAIARDRAAEKPISVNIEDL